MMIYGSMSHQSGSFAIELEGRNYSFLLFLGDDVLGATVASAARLFLCVTPTGSLCRRQSLRSDRRAG